MRKTLRQVGTILDRERHEPGTKIPIIIEHVADPFGTPNGHLDRPGMRTRFAQPRHVAPSGKSDRWTLVFNIFTKFDVSPASLQLPGSPFVLLREERNDPTRIDLPSGQFVYSLKRLMTYKRR
jgi:hypothetical protein